MQKVKDKAQAIVDDIAVRKASCSLYFSLRKNVALASKHMFFNWFAILFYSKCVLECKKTMYLKFFLQNVTFWTSL